MSRLDLARDAVRPALKARIMLSGPSGSGKTRTGLIIATVLAAETDGSIVVIDTEKESALTFADDFTFKHVRWLPPYDPRELAEVVVEAGEQYAVTMCDSLSHFWRKAGGTLDIAEGKFSGWKAARPAQEDLVDAVLDSKGHVILCCRSVEDYVQEVENGRHVVRKLGMAPQQDSTLMYEVNVGLEIDMEHRLTVSKSRSTAVQVGRFYHPGHAGDFAEVYRDWLNAGEPPAHRDIVASIERRIGALPVRIRKACKEDFFARHGRPAQLRDSAVVDAEALVARYETEAEGAGPDPDPDPGPGGGEDDAGGTPDSDAGDNDTSTPARASGANVDEPPASSTANDAGQRPPQGVTARQVGQKAGLVFKAEYDAAPRGGKTRIVDRLRHALVYAQTGGAIASVGACDGHQLLQVWQRLDDIAEGRLTYEISHGDDGGVTWISQTGDRTTVMWSEAEMTATGPGEAA